MKTSLSLLLVLPLLLFTTCTKEEIQIQTDSDASVSLRSSDVPLKGELTFTTILTDFDPETGIATNIYEGGGKLSHLGRSTCVVIQNIPPEGDYYGTFEITAANGDQLDMEYTGRLTSLDPATLDFTSENEWNITGGSGRFDDATGNGEGPSYGTFPQFPPEDPVTITVEIDGEINY